jgi:NADH:ubiquinone oxidoreductase subunit K
VIVTIVLLTIIGLLATGLYALLVVRNLIKVFVALQILVKGAILAMIASGQVAGQAEVGESMALTVIVVDTIVAVVGLALAVQIRRHFGTLDVRAYSTLKR